MSCPTCSTTVTIDYSASVLNLTGMKEGFAFGDFLEFFDEDGAALDITGDIFEWEVFDSTLTLVATLVLTGGVLVGGLEIEGTNKLNFLFGSPVTDTAGTYTHRLILTDPVNGNDAPIAIGKIIVKP